MATKTATCASIGAMPYQKNGHLSPYLSTHHGKAGQVAAVREPMRRSKMQL
jgi:hypothetical protein